MDIDDLKKFIEIAHCNNLQQAASRLNQTPGALSKVIKRLELKLNTELFDRLGRGIILNHAGEKFRQYAVNLVHETEQAISEFNGANNKTLVKLAGPTVLMEHYLPPLIKTLDNSHFFNPEFKITTIWEGNAVNQVATGQVHMALVTTAALFQNQHSSDFHRIPLGKTRFKVVAAKTHPILSRYPNQKVSISQLKDFCFACPTVSPFCGLKRGIGSDGWRDDKVPRTIGFRFDDFGSLMSVVNAGLALAYVPDFVALHHNLAIINVTDCEHSSAEEIELVYKPSLASGWLNQIGDVLVRHYG